MKNNEKTIIREMLEKIDLSDSVYKSKIQKNYEEKIIPKLYCNNVREVATDINNIVVLLNFCFHTKNDFFIVDFNKSLTHKIMVFYNNLKNNILTEGAFYNDVFEFMDITDKSALMIRFILKRYKNNFNVIAQYFPQLTNQVTEESIDRLISLLNEEIKKPVN